MSDEWRFRVSWFGKIILQRKQTHFEYNSYDLDSYEVVKWCDATSNDMLDFYKQSTNK